MGKIMIIRPGAKHPVLMRDREAHRLVRAGKFRYVDAPSPTLPRAGARAAKRDAARSASPVLNKTTGEPVEEEAQTLEGKTKEQLITLLESYGEKIDKRQGKSRLLAQAMRYKRRDMRAE